MAPSQAQRPPLSHLQWTASEAAPVLGLVQAPVQPLLLVAMVMRPWQRHCVQPAPTVLRRQMGRVLMQLLRPMRV